MQQWFTSDTHFGHANIIRYCDRPFKHQTEMNEVMIERWNEKVAPDDHVYHLGDFSFGQRSWSEGVVWRLNGVIHCLTGNHDKKKRMPRHIDGKFIHLGHYHELVVEEKSIRWGILPIILCHYPFDSWNKSCHGSVHLHGHCHGNLKTTRNRRLDVGVDCHDFYPLSLEEIKEMLIKQPINSVDHHKGA